MKLPTDRFVEWMHSRGGYYADFKLKYYCDGEPYFSSPWGAEMSLSDFLEREEELTSPEQPKLL